MFNIAPSLMCANLLELGSQVRELERAGARLFHIDAMDGHFVPNLGLSFDLVRQVQSITNADLDVHLMVDAPEHYVEWIRALKINYV
jgi:ribulose-phosphate 3-epimerase